MESENLLTGNVEYLKEVLDGLQDLKKEKERCNSLTAQLKELERNITGEEKAIKNETENTVKKRREEITASFDKEIREDQNRLRKIKADREKAKTKGIAGRIEEETAQVREENKQFSLQIKSVIKEAKLPWICSQSWYYLLFYPKRAEWMVLLLLLIVWLYFAPYGICLLLKLQSLRVITGVSFVFAFIFFAVYLFILNQTKGNKWAAVRQVRAIRDKATANRKKERAIRNAIHKDRDEQPYHLEDFDKKIKELEEEIHNTDSEKQKALAVFEETTKKLLTEEIESRSREKLNNLKQSQQKMAADLREAEQSVKNKNQYITANYEALLGKEYVTEQAVLEMISLMENKNLSTVGEALDLYKAEH